MITLESNHLKESTCKTLTHPVNSITDPSGVREKKQDIQTAIIILVQIMVLLTHSKAKTILITEARGIITKETTEEVWNSA